MLRLLTTGSAAVAALAAPLLHAPRRALVWNASASAPRGLYYIQKVTHPRVGELVLVRPPAALARFLGQRGYVPGGVPLLKRVAAEPGQIVCRYGSAILIDGQLRAIARLRDRDGRALPVWSGCRQLRPSDAFLLNAAPDSLDSRYFGRLPSSSIIGQAAPIWTETAR